ncbi:Hypothetical protein CAP_3836 [Chondromyces apiculatus DSM 436]|uniref:Uncharacterized protein n=1 Tax=Chondromyces apiculatus DSM 436 TaxID=1192034 RepID=A0A017T7M2_9BACT|nr:Hypothetical protein CAP_3836 [Chondromyces apiculatus DSM 436]
MLAHLRRRSREAEGHGRAARRAGGGAVERRAHCGNILKARPGAAPCFPLTGPIPRSGREPRRQGG